jgi:predicted metal-binding membrane protein
MAAFPVGVTLAGFAMQQPSLSRAVPSLSGIAVLVAGLFQFTAWKARQLACWRDASGRADVLPGDVPAAWREGLRLGLLCVRCCVNLMAILLVAGVMDLRVMAAVTVAITAERLGPAGRIARVVGAFAVAAGALLVARLIS